jgi:mannose-6-phosphate isomerase-like protein (cupin superfamily)
MRTMTIGALAVGLLVAGWTWRSSAQGQAPPAKTFVSAADVAALIEKAKGARKPDQPNLVQPMLQLAPYTANLEYRMGKDAPASAHDVEAELFYVIDGSGTLVTGGTLHDEKRTNAENRSGTRIDGGLRQVVSKGDIAFVPENTPHWFTDIPGTLVMMSFHVPRGGKNEAH